MKLATELLVPKECKASSPCFFDHNCGAYIMLHFYEQLSKTCENNKFERGIEFIMNSGQEEKIKLLSRLISESREMVVFSGAGISTESGLADFRSPGGIWDRFDPSELSYPNFISNPESRKKYWEFYRENWKVSRDASPNKAHLAVAELDKKYEKVSAVITQNIDGLHQKAGSSREKVFEIHGNMWAVQCLSCNDHYDWEEIYKGLEQGKGVENCMQCGGLVKPATISFGQSLPADVLGKAQHYSSNCDLFFCIGSSLVVYPAAMLPEVAKGAGAKLAILNRDPTPLDDMADVVINGEAAAMMELLLDMLENEGS